MSRQSFFKQLGALSILLTLLLFLLHSFAPFNGYSNLSWMSLILFILLTIGMYFGGLKATMSENKHTFTNVVLLFTIGKMVLSIVVILGYYEWAQPDSKLFIIPFFAIYVAFTIFETYFMMKLGKMKT